MFGLSQQQGKFENNNLASGEADVELAVKAEHVAEAIAQEAWAAAKRGEAAARCARKPKQNGWELEPELREL